jgi:hypothetical protein
MVNPSPFEVGRQVGTNFASTMRNMRDEGAIEQILAQADSSGDPEVMQRSIGQILSQVSPERQRLAVQYLQNAYQGIQARKQEAAKREAAAKYFGSEEAANLPPQVQAQLAKDRAKQERLAQFGIGGDLMPSGQAIMPQSGDAQGVQSNAQQKRSLSDFSDEQLLNLTGFPDKEIAEPAKAILAKRENEKKLQQRENENWTKFGMDRATKVLDEVEKVGAALPQKESALNLMKNALTTKNLGFWTGDNLAEITGIELFRSPESALFKTAGKEYFLGNIARAGARPNQWIEQQIADMLPKIGRSTEANLSVERALENELAIEKERLRLTDEIFNKLKTEKKDIGNLGTEVNKQLSKFADEKQNELYNDLRAIKSIGEKKPQSFQKVKLGTKISPYMVEALLNKFNNDPEKALAEAKSLGYSIE